MTQCNLKKSYLGLFLLLWLLFGMGFKSEASSIPESGREPGRESLEGQDTYTLEVARLESGEYSGLAIQHRRNAKRKGSWLWVVLILFGFWKNYFSGKYWCDIILEKAKKEYVGAFKRRGPPLNGEVF